MVFIVRGDKRRPRAYALYAFLRTASAYIYDSGGRNDGASKAKPIAFADAYVRERFKLCPGVRCLITASPIDILSEFMVTKRACDKSAFFRRPGQRRAVVSCLARSLSRTGACWC